MANKIRIHLTGRRFGRLAAGSEAESRKGNRYYECRCECGAVCVVSYANLTAGQTRSCGCLKPRAKPRLQRPRDPKRAKAPTEMPEYAVWKAMIWRCHSETNSAYKNYGARGIRVHASWRASFMAFLRDVGPRPSDDLSIERIDNDRGYEPGNCRWATSKDQGRNQRRTVRIPFRGAMVAIGDVADALGIPAPTLYMRLRNGWDLADVLSPVLHHRRNKG